MSEVKRFRRIGFRHTETIECVLASDYDQLKAENERLRNVTHVSLPTSTMEQEFSNYHRRGFNAGIKQGQDERDTLRKQLDEALELLHVASEIIHEQAIHIDRPMTNLGSESLAKIDAWLEANK